MRGFRKYIKKPVMAFLKKTFSNERIVHISEGDLFMMRKMIFYTVNPNPYPNPNPNPNHNHNHNPNLNPNPRSSGQSSSS